MCAIEVVNFFFLHQNILPYKKDLHLAHIELLIRPPRPLSANKSSDCGLVSEEAGLAWSIG